MKALEFRKLLKKKSPDFIRQRPHAFKLKNKLKWRRAKGIHSKMRLSHKGNPKMPKTGYGSPKSVRYLNPQGLMEVMINTINDLKIDAKTQIALLSKTLGIRKRLVIVKKAKELGVEISNIESADKYIKETEDFIKEKRKESSEKKKSRLKSKEKTKDKKEVKDVKLEEEKKKETKEAITNVEGKEKPMEAGQKTQAKQAPVRNIPQAKK